MQPDTYSTTQASRILGISPRRAQQLAETGKLEGKKFDGREWRLYQHSVHAYLEEHGPGKRAQRSREGALESSETVSEWVDRVADLERQLGRLEGRLELTELTESTLREQLERERERADKLQDELARSRRSWWKKLFGIE